MASVKDGPSGGAGASVSTFGMGLWRAALWFGVRSLSILGVLLLWEILARSGTVSPFMLPTIGLVVDRLIDDVVTGEFLLNASESLYRALTGFAIAAVSGVVLGMMMVRNRVARWFFDPIISAGFPMPKIAFLPIFILWFGVHDLSKITMVAVDAVFPVVTATIIGLSSVERELLWSGRNMGASERRLLWQICLPAALPQILTGLQVALPIALIVAIATEMLMGGIGLGGAVLEASRMADSPAVFAGIIQIAVMGYCVIKIMALVRRRLLVWHQETQRPTTL